MTNTRGDVWSLSEYQLFYPSVIRFLISISFEFQLWIAPELTLIWNRIMWLSGIINMDDSYSFIQGQCDSNQCLLLRRGRIEFCQGIVKGGRSLPATQWSHKAIPLGAYTCYLKYVECLAVTVLYSKLSLCQFLKNQPGMWLVSFSVCQLSHSRKKAYYLVWHSVAVLS